jgi:lipid-A-disaccharide synthase-like uncharacterized protein
VSDLVPALVRHGDPSRIVAMPAVPSRETPASRLGREGGSMSDLTLWLTIGFLGQALFTARFLVQWIVSESRRDSVVPVAFWWLSLLGGLVLLSYAIHRRDPVIIVGQGLGLFVYARNLMLVGKARRRAAKLQRRRRAATGRHEPPSIPTAPHRVRAPEEGRLPLTTTGSSGTSPPRA